MWLICIFVFAYLSYLYFSFFLFYASYLLFYFLFYLLPSRILDPLRFQAGGRRTPVGRRYHVRWGTRSPMEGAIFRGTAAHCKVMGHSMVSCAKTAEPIDMPFWMKTWVGQRNHVLMRCRSPNGKGQFWGIVRVIQKHWQSSLQPSLRCKRNHSIANNVMQQKGSFSMPDKCK